MADFLPSPRPLLVAGLLLLGTVAGRADEPAAINPFGPHTQGREDAVPGYLELSDGSIHAGHLYLTRDARLKVFDEAQQRFREVPLQVIQRIDCRVQKEWLEKEWRFKENANDEKVYTGHSYPVREYVHTFTLHDGRTIRGPLSGVVSVEPEPGAEPERFLLHKRDKGEVDEPLNALLYVRSIHLGDEALDEGKQKAAEKAKKKGQRARRSQ